MMKALYLFAFASNLFFVLKWSAAGDAGMAAAHAFVGGMALSGVLYELIVDRWRSLYRTLMEANNERPRVDAPDAGRGPAPGDGDGEHKAAPGRCDTCGSRTVCGRCSCPDSEF
jgi:hypothetical protein